MRRSSSCAGAYSQEPPGIEPEGRTVARRAGSTRVTRPRWAGRTAAWGVLDQILSASSNAGMTFVAANVLGARDFGVYALMFTAMTMLIGASRALTSEAYTVLMTNADLATRLSRQGQCLGASVAIGLVAAIIGGGVGIGVGVAGGVVFAVASIGVLAQDAQRYILVTEGRVRAAFANDLVWVTAQFGVLLPLIWWGEPTIGGLAACWGVGAAVAVGVGTWQLRVSPAIRGARKWFGDTKGYSAYYAAEFMAVAGSGYSIVYLVALVVGVEGAGAYRGAQAIFGPVTTLVGGLRMVALPSIVRMRTQGRSRVVRASVGFALLLLAASVVVTVMIWGLRGWLAPLLLGATASAAIPLIIPMGLGRAFSSASGGLAVGFRALGATKRSLFSRLVIAGLTLGAAVGGAMLGHAEGAAWGFALGSTVGTLVWAGMLKRQELSLDDRTALK